MRSVPRRKPGINSRNKGKDGELELAKLLRDHGYPDARRGQQHMGGPDSPDVLGGPEEFHLECKRVESGSPYVWLAQAQRDAGKGKIPVVCHRKNNKDWIAILPLEDLLNLLIGKAS